MYDNRKHYLEQSHKAMKAAESGIDGMSSDQFAAINYAIEAINDAMDYALECHDLRLSDIDKLRTAQFKLANSIDTTPSDYQIKGWKEYGIGEYADDDTADTSIHERTEPHITF